MKKTITKIGNSQGIVLDAAVMELAHLRAGDEVNLEIHDSGTITLTPIRPRLSRTAISDVVRTTLRDYRRTMKRLA